MKYYMIAGEASGDLHGSNLIKELRKLDKNANIRCWGGELMAAAGGQVVKHYRDLAFMGFIEVVRNLPAILKNMKFCKEDIKNFQPDVLVLIDYPGFNLRIAKWAKKEGYGVVYYISPQVWAWKENRTRTIKEAVDKMLVILPFEKDFFARWNYPVVYVGHPLAQVVGDFLESHREEKISTRPIIAILPGSRKQEVAAKLPIMLSVTRDFPEFDFVVAKAPSLEDAFYEGILKEYPGTLTVKNETYKLLAQASAALVTSGTATLETALFGVPQVVCYKGSSLSYQIAKRLIKIKFISLVNLIMDRPVVTELIQNDLNSENLKKELAAILYDPARAAAIRQGYAQLKRLLQQKESASARAAQEIVGFTQGLLPEEKLDYQNNQGHHKQ
ncbi:MAG: lipid-A-disaccharide synthase [Flavisolibacter sp.]